MARLFLLRHAKSSWDDNAGSDFDRPLNLRGRAAAPLMGRHMANHSMRPERVLCSSARRTRETLAGILPYLEGDFEARLMRAVYSQSEGDYLPILRAHGGSVATLMLIGHNPAIQATATALIGRGNPDLTRLVADKYPTAGLAVIDFENNDWSKLQPGSGRIVAFFRPRELEIVGGETPVDTDD